MNRKLSLIVTALTVVLSIAFVVFFGIKAEASPKTIRVNEIMFVNSKGGKADDKYDLNLMEFKKGTETMEVYYYIGPDDAADKRIHVYFDDFGVGSSLEVKPSLSNDCVLDIDFKGSVLENFFIRITSINNSTVYAEMFFCVE